MGSSGSHCPRCLMQSLLIRPGRHCWVPAPVIVSSVCQWCLLQSLPIPQVYFSMRKSQDSRKPTVLFSRPGSPMSLNGSSSNSRRRCQLGLGDPGGARRPWTLGASFGPPRPSRRPRSLDFLAFSSEELLWGPLGSCGLWHRVKMYSQTVPFTLNSLDICFVLSQVVLPSTSHHPRARC